MTQQFIDTQPVVATCNRCGGYVFACMVGGSKVAVDLAPLGVEAYRAAVASRRGTYDQLDQAGRPWRLRARTASSQWPPWAGRSVLGDHACGAQGQDVQAVTPVNPPSSGAPSTARQTAAPDGVPHPSSLWRCNTCHTLIEKDEPFYGIEHGYKRWARHDRDCAPKHAGVA